MRQRQQRAVAKHGQEAAEIGKRLRGLQSRSGHHLSRLWADWISAMALAISNACDTRPEVHARRETEYMQIVERHGAPTMLAFAEMLGLLTAALEDAPADVLGGIYMALELGSDCAGQFFTPTGLCEVLADLLVQPDDLHEQVKRRGWVAIHEPAIGGGATVIPIVARVLAAGLNPAEHMHVTGVDVDATVLRMAYVQLGLLGVPAALQVGNSLTMVMRDDWYTPIHVLHGWGPRLRMSADMQAMLDALTHLSRKVVE